MKLLLTIIISIHKYTPYMAYILFKIIIIEYKPFAHVYIENYEHSYIKNTFSFLCQIPLPTCLWRKNIKIINVFPHSAFSLRNIFSTDKKVKKKKTLNFFPPKKLSCSFCSFPPVSTTNRITSTIIILYLC